MKNSADYGFLDPGTGKLIVPIPWEDWREPPLGSSEPCGHPDPDECDCEGTCSCHWVEMPEPPADLPGLWDGVPLDVAGRLLVGSQSPMVGPRAGEEQEDR